jgi:uncharacterized protein (TIGR02266 family)
MEDNGRRSTPRVDVVLQLQYRSAGHLLVNYCTNLSRGGLFVPSTEPLPVGTQLQLELTVPGDATTTVLEGEVRWVRQFDADEGPAGMGVKFRDVDSALGRRIDLLVSDFEPLRVFVIGRHESLRAAIASQVRMLVRCETFEYDSPVGLLEEMGRADLVVADGNPVPDETLAFLRALETLDRPPPRVVLCDTKAEDRRRHFAPLSRLLDTPVDPAVLRDVVLDTLSHVYSQRRS